MKGGGFGGAVRGVLPTTGSLGPVMITNQDMPISASLASELAGQAPGAPKKLQEAARQPDHVKAAGRQATKDNAANGMSKFPNCV